LCPASSLLFFYFNIFAIFQFHFVILNYEDFYKNSIIINRILYFLEVLLCACTAKTLKPLTLSALGLKNDFLIKSSVKEGFIKLRSTKLYLFNIISTKEVREKNLQAYTRGRELKMGLRTMSLIGMGALYLEFRISSGVQLQEKEKPCFPKAPEFEE
jgi:hypothetical protein